MIMKKYPVWQLNFINGYLFHLSNAARRRVIQENSYPFIKGIKTEEWEEIISNKITGGTYIIEEPRWKILKQK